MKTIRLLLLSALLILSITCNPSNTEWTDPVSGTKYDFTALRKSPE
jgi:hypothetical protein